MPLLDAHAVPRLGVGRQGEARAANERMGDELRGELPAFGIALPPARVVLQGAGHDDARHRGLDDVRVGVGNPLGRITDLAHPAWLAVAEKAFDFFLEADGSKYDKAVACLAKDRAVLLAFYDFPAEHWKHIRTTNPIESTLATVRLRTTKTKGCLSRMTALTMVFKPCQSAAKKWRRLDGSHQIADIIQGSNSRAEKS